MRQFQRRSAIAMIPLMLAMLVILTGCSKDESVPYADAPPPEPAAPAEPEVFPITATEVVVEEADIPQVSMQKRLEADFNQDNLEDIAVVEEDEDGNSTVSIYLQKADGDALKRAFYKAGGIRLTGEFAVTALMSKSRSDYTDLIAIQQYTDGGKEMVHFRTTGTDFREVERVAIK